MRISDWSSDVCSSDLPIGVVDLDEAFVAQHQRGLAAGAERQRVFDLRAQPQPDIIAIAAQPLLQPHPARQLAAREPAERETRPEERRVGKEWYSTGRPRWSPYN